ncbi:MAG TPA: hypothetical protein VGZ47_05525 [Gemmataceae bacterium]|nr:hypothetical protein [Gemmataceae bacterium]
MRKRIVFSGAVTAVVGVTIGGWLTAGHSHCAWTFVSGCGQAIGVCQLNSDRPATESRPVQVLEFEPVSANEPQVSEEPEKWIEVIDLTELQRVPQQGTETVEPPLAEPIPAEFVPTPDGNVQRAGYEEKPTGALTEKQIPADFLLHSADGLPAVGNPNFADWWLLFLKWFQGIFQPDYSDDEVTCDPLTGFDRAYHQQHPGCPYHGGSPLEHPLAPFPEAWARVLLFISPIP